MSDKAKIEKLACAMWAKEKCTTRFGIDIDAWETMHPEPKRAWLKRAREHYKARPQQS